MTWWAWVLIAWVAASIVFTVGLMFGTALGANARADLEAQVSDLQRRLLARYEEHA